MPPRKTSRTTSKKTVTRARVAPARKIAGKVAVPKGKALGPRKSAAAVKSSRNGETAQLLSSEEVYRGRLFRVVRDKIVEPTGLEAERDVVRHNGSAVILAVDRSGGKKGGSKKNPWIVMERQYRHAANRFLWELPAGKLEAGEDPLAGAKRELEEETGYQARSWKPLVEYWPSPGFVGESMQVFLAEGLYAGKTNFDEDERIELRLVKLSEVLKMIGKGAIHDGKTLNAVLLYAWLNGRKRKK